MQETWVQPLCREDSLGEGNGNPLQYSCLGNPMYSTVAGYSPQGRIRVRHDLATKPQQSYVCYLFLKKFLQEKWVGAKLCRITLISSQKSPNKLSWLKAGVNLVIRKALQLLRTSEQNPEDTNCIPSALILSNVSICKKERQFHVP